MKAKRPFESPRTGAQLFQDQDCFCLALRFHGLFDLGLLFLFFLLELVADELEDGDLSSIAHANARGDDARVASRAIRELRCDIAEELLRDARRHDVSRRLPSRLQRVALAERDHFFRHWPRRFRAGQCRSDAPVFKKIGHQIPQRRAAVPWIASQFRSRFQVSHVSFFLASSYRPTESSVEGAAVWLGSGGQMMRPCSSNFMPRLRPIFTSMSLISFSDLRPKFFVFSISFSLFCTSSRMVWMLAFFRQLYERTESSSSSTLRSRCSRRGSFA